MFLRNNLLCEVRYKKAGSPSEPRIAAEIDPGSLERLKAAGVLQVVDGKLLLINNYSGHYLPEKSYLEQATTQLRQQGIAIAPAMVDAGGGEAW